MSSSLLISWPSIIVANLRIERLSTNMQPRSHKHRLMFWSVEQLSGDMYPLIGWLMSSSIIEFWYWSKRRIATLRTIFLSQFHSKHRNTLKFWAKLQWGLNKFLRLRYSCNDIRFSSEKLLEIQSHKDLCRGVYKRSKIGCLGQL